MQAQTVFKIEEIGRNLWIIYIVAELPGAIIVSLVFHVSFVASFLFGWVLFAVLTGLLWLMFSLVDHVSPVPSVTVPTDARDGTWQTARVARKRTQADDRVVGELQAVSKTYGTITQLHERDRKREDDVRDDR